FSIFIIHHLLVIKLPVGQTYCFSQDQYNIANVNLVVWCRNVVDQRCDVCMECFFSRRLGQSGRKLQRLKSVCDADSCRSGDFAIRQYDFYADRRQGSRIAESVGAGYGDVIDTFHHIGNRESPGSAGYGCRGSRSGTDGDINGRARFHRTADGLGLDPGHSGNRVKGEGGYDGIDGQGSLLDADISRGVGCLDRHCAESVGKRRHGCSGCRGRGDDCTVDLDGGNSKVPVGGGEGNDRRIVLGRRALALQGESNNRRGGVNYDGRGERRRRVAGGRKGSVVGVDHDVVDGEAGGVALCSQDGSSEGPGSAGHCGCGRNAAVNRYRNSPNAVSIAGRAGKGLSSSCLNECGAGDGKNWRCAVGNAGYRGRCRGNADPGDGYGCAPGAVSAYRGEFYVEITVRSGSKGGDAGGARQHC